MCVGGFGHLVTSLALEVQLEVRAGVVLENTLGLLENGGGTDVGGLASSLFAPLQLLTYLSAGERS